MRLEHDLVCLKSDVLVRVREGHDTPNMKIRDFDKGDKVIVQNFWGGRERYVIGVVAKRLGTLTYLVKVGQKLRHCHADHLLAVGQTSFPSQNGNADLPITDARTERSSLKVQVTN